MTHSGGQPHNVGDKGQRYVVNYRESEGGQWRCFGYSNTKEGADAMVKSIKAHPTWDSPKIIDRQPNKGEKP